MTTYIVADEIHFNGYRVAILTADAPATVLGEFEDGVNNATLFEATPKVEGMTPDELKDTVAQETAQAIFDIAVSVARGGLISVKDFRIAIEREGTKLS